MFKLLLLFYGFGTLLALNVQSTGRLDLSPELKGRFDAAYSVVETVNLADAGWEAQVYPRFARMSDEERRSMNGLVINKNKAPLFKGPIAETPIVIKAEELPEEFDPRKQWPQCVNVIDNIRDQSNCGSCWAVAAAGVLSDRICIKSKGHMNLSISSIDIASCALSPMDGCGGAQDLSPAWKYLQQKGTVTGHNYKSNVGCKPYPFPPSKDAREQPYQTPTCMEECTNKEYERKYDEDRIQTAEPIRLQTNDWKNMEHLIKQEVYVNGSVEVGFTIYKDFYYYSKGVYKHTYGREEGGHAVRLVGWGVEKEVPYWLIANSWGPEWGEKGYFRIRRGFNECGIEGLTDPYAGEPILKMSH